MECIKKFNYEFCAKHYNKTASKKVHKLNERMNYFTNECKKV